MAGCLFPKTATIKGGATPQPCAEPCVTSRHPSPRSPVIIEVPHFASLRGREREIVILRSDNGETWKEHTLEASEEAVQEVLNESFDGDGERVERERRVKL